MFKFSPQISIDAFHEKKLEWRFHVDKMFPIIKDELETIEFMVVMISKYKKDHG